MEDPADDLGQWEFGERNEEDEDEDLDESEGVKLVDPLNIAKVQADGGTIFDIVMPEEAKEGGATYFDPEKIFNEDEGREVPSWDDGVGDDGSAEDDERTAFDIMTSRMEDVTGDKGVMKRVIRPGIGPVVADGAFVRAHLDGFLEYADEPFDSTRLQNREKRWKLGQGEVITGIDLGVKSMRKTELAEILLDPSYAYGKLGAPPRIPKDARVLFRVELLDYTEYAGADEYYSLPMEERKEADFHLIRKVIEAEKKNAQILAQVYCVMQEAGDWFRRKCYGKALGKYKKVIKILEDFHAKGDEDDAQREKYLMKMYQNAALTSLRLSRPDATLRYCRDALEIQSNCAKAFYLRGRAFTMQGHFKPAQDAFAKAQRLSPGDKDIKAAMEELAKKMKKEALTERETYRRMFGFEGKVEFTEENAEVPSPKVDKSGCSPEFKEQIQKLIQEFQENVDREEMPLPSKQFSMAEATLILDVAKEMGIECSEVGDGENMRFMFRRKKEPSEEE